MKRLVHPNNNVPTLRTIDDLYAQDETMEDERFCDDVKRGSFRLHPKGPLGRSEGCITIDGAHDFHYIQAMLRSAPPHSIPRSALKAYGRVWVQ